MWDAILGTGLSGSVSVIDYAGSREATIHRPDLAAGQTLQVARQIHWAIASRGDVACGVLKRLRVAMKYCQPSTSSLEDG